eukprot:1218178-Prorocentrum_lima.AAC.1
MTSSLVGSEMCIRDSLKLIMHKAEVKEVAGITWSKVRPSDRLAISIFNSCLLYTSDAADDM